MDKAFPECIVMKQSSWMFPMCHCLFGLQEEKDQLNEFKTHLEGLNRRAKTVIQLKPRNTAHPVKGKLPIQAVCDFKQMEVKQRPFLT